MKQPQQVRCSKFPFWFGSIPSRFAGPTLTRQTKQQQKLTFQQENTTHQPVVEGQPFGFPN